MKIRQGVLPNSKLGDDIGIWEGSIVYEVLYFVLKAEIVLVLWPVVWWKWQYSLRFQVGGTGLCIGVRSRGLMNPLEDKFSYAWARVIPRSENSWRVFFFKLW